MKKKILIGLGVICLAIIFIGFGFTKNIEMQKEYQRAFDRGVKATKKGNYQSAKIDFQDALKRKQEDPQATKNLNQLETYTQAKAQLKQKNYDQAETLFNQAAQIDGMNVLIRRASTSATKIDDMVSQLKIFEKIYDQAEKLSDSGKYPASNDKLATILEYRKINTSYFDSIRAKAKELKKQNNQNIKQDGPPQTNQVQGGNP